MVDGVTGVLPLLARYRHKDCRRVEEKLPPTINMIDARWQVQMLICWRGSACRCGVIGPLESRCARIFSVASQSCIFRRFYAGNPF
jgi:hypothetical protein